MIREIVEANARRSPVVAILPEEDEVPSGAAAIVRADPESGDRVHLSR